MFYSSDVHSKSIDIKYRKCIREIFFLINEDIPVSDYKKHSVVFLSIHHLNSNLSEDVCARINYPILDRLVKKIKEIREEYSRPHLKLLFKSSESPLISKIRVDLLDILFVLNVFIEIRPNEAPPENECCKCSVM